MTRRRVFRVINVVCVNRSCLYFEVNEEEHEEALRAFSSFGGGAAAGGEEGDQQQQDGSSTTPTAAKRKMYRKPDVQQSAAAAKYLVAHKFTDASRNQTGDGDGGGGGGGGGGGANGEGTATHHRLIGTPLSEFRLLMKTQYASLTDMVQKAKNAEVDTAFQLATQKSVIAESIRIGFLKPPALGEDVILPGQEGLFLEMLAFRANRCLFLRLLMLLEYLRLKQAAASEPFWGTAMVRKFRLSAEQTILTTEPNHVLSPPQFIHIRIHSLF